MDDIEFLTLKSYVWNDVFNSKFLFFKTDLNQNEYLKVHKIIEVDERG